MDNLDNLNERIDQLVAEKHQSILADLFFRIKKDHSSHNWKTCDCSLCKILKQYVFEKIQLHKVKRMIYYGGHVFQDDLEFFNSYNFYDISHIKEHFLLDKGMKLKNSLMKKRQEMRKII